MSGWAARWAELGFTEPPPRLNVFHRDEPPAQ